MLSSKLNKTHDILLMSVHVLMTCVVHDITTARVSENKFVERTCRRSFARLLWLCFFCGGRVLGAKKCKAECNEYISDGQCMDIDMTGM